MQYEQVVKKLADMHYRYLNERIAEDPIKLNSLMSEMRGYAALILPFINQAISLQIDATRAVAQKRQELYEEMLEKKASPSAALNHSREMTRRLEAEQEITTLKVKQLQNDYSRYDTIIMGAQSRVKTYNTTKMMDK